MTTLKLILTKWLRFPSPLWIINEWLKKIFLPKTLRHYEKLKKPYGIIIHDHMLKFHNNDIRKQITKELLD